MQLRISVFTPWFPNTRDGWPARFIADSAIALNEAGSYVSVNVLRGWVPIGLKNFAAREHHGSIDSRQFPEIARLRTYLYLTVPGNSLRPLTNVSLDQAVATAFYSELRHYRPDIIHIQTELLAPKLVALAREHKIPVVVTIHGENTNKKYTQSLSQARRFRSALSDADRIVIVGEPLRAYVESLSGRVDNISTVWNGAGTALGERQAPTPDSQSVGFVCVANMQEGKGIDLLISALSSLKPDFDNAICDWQLTIIGDGPLRNNLQVQVERLGLTSRVSFLGTMPNSEVLKNLLRYDVFVLPSYRESFGIVYAEAMISGLLTIGVEGQGPAQFIVHGKTGLLVKPRDVDSLTATLRGVLSDPQRLWRGIAKAGAIFARVNCSWSSHADRMLEVFHSACSSRSRESFGKERWRRPRGSRSVGADGDP